MSMRVGRLAAKPAVGAVRQAQPPASGRRHEQRVLALQSTMGNAAVARALRRERPGRLQRKIGFEAELSVPTIPPAAAALEPAMQVHPRPDGLRPTLNLQAFLSGGFGYGPHAELGGAAPAGAHFELKADHNVLHERHTQLRTKLEELGYPLPASTAMSNLEYVTPAEDELAAGSTALIREHLDAISRHAADLFPAVKSQMSAIPRPGAGALTGLPVEDLRAWLGPDYAHVAGEVRALADAIEDRFSIQATAGIMPSAIRSLFRRHTRFWPRTVREGILVDVRAEVRRRLVEEDPTFIDHKYVKRLKREDRRAYEGLVGILHLLYSYVVGDALNQSAFLDGASPKGAVPFLSKMTHMGLVMQAAGLAAHPMPEDLAEYIERRFADTEIAKPKYWQRRLGKAKHPEVRVVRPHFVREVLVGLDDVWAVNSPRQFAAPDKLPELEAHGLTQRGVQLEYRWLPDSPDSSRLTDRLMKVVDEVREVNTRELGFFDRRALIAAANRPEGPAAGPAPAEADLAPAAAGSL